MNDTISKKQIKDILKKQDNKCAKKPYSRIKYLEKHSCPSWKNNIDIIKSYHIIKSQNNHIALCTSCFNVYTKKKKQSETKKTRSSSVDKRPDEKKINLDYSKFNAPILKRIIEPIDRKHVLGQYQVIYISTDKNYVN